MTGTVGRLKSDYLERVEGLGTEPVAQYPKDPPQDCESIRFWGAALSIGQVNMLRWQAPETDA